MSFNDQNDSFNSSASTHYSSVNDETTWQPDEFVTSTQASSVSEQQSAASISETDFSFNCNDPLDNIIASTDNFNTYGLSFNSNDYQYVYDYTLQTAWNHHMMLHKQNVARETSIGDTTYDSNSSHQSSYETDSSYNSQVNNSTFWDTTQDSN